MSKSVIQPCPCCGGKARLKQAKYNVLGSYGDAELDKHWYGICLLYTSPSPRDTR